MADIVLSSFADTYWFSWGVLPLLIFTARILDVSIGTVRVVFIARGCKYLAPLAGFFEVLIWILVIGQIFKNLSNPLCYIAYASGFAMGNYVGMILAEKLSLGMVMIHVLASQDASSLVESFRLKGYGATTLQGQGAFGPTTVLFTIVPKKEVEQVVKLIENFNPNAFYSIEDVESVSKDLMPKPRRAAVNPLFSILRPFRKGK